MILSSRINLSPIWKDACSTNGSVDHAFGRAQGGNVAGTINAGDALVTGGDLFPMADLEEAHREARALVELLRPALRGERPALWQTDSQVTFGITFQPHRAGTVPSTTKTYRGTNVAKFLARAGDILISN